MPLRQRRRAMIPADPLRNLGPATILRGDARHLPLPEDSVDDPRFNDPATDGALDARGEDED